MTERDKILGRIREALQTKAPKPGSHGEICDHALPEPPTTHARTWLPSVGKSVEEQLELFARNCADLKADYRLLAGREELKIVLAKIATTENWKRLASHDGELSNFAARSLNLPVLLTDNGYDIQALEKCDAGITECDALIAQTGGVLVTSRSTGGRALTILPPHHVIIARREQLVADLPAAFALVQQKYSPDFPSMISFITGPSRTGDIERILVLGAHGPKKLTILCI
jgi:L-lactate dehydrogenase complex protein LldG